MMLEAQNETLAFRPVFDENSKILILGSFPSVVSRKLGFYYANPQNRFWRVLAQIFDSPLPSSKDEKINFLLSHKIAIYDAALSCEIKGSSDAAMREVVPVNLSAIFAVADILQVFANGGKAYEISKKFLEADIEKATKNKIVQLPSTSPANAKFSLQGLVSRWQVVKNFVV